MAETENKDYVQIYKRVLDYHRKYSGMEGSDTEWEQCCNDGDTIVRSFGNGQFVRDLIIAIQNEIARKLKKAEKNEQRGISDIKRKFE